MRWNVAPELLDPQAVGMLASYPVLKAGDAIRRLRQADERAAAKAIRDVELMKLDRFAPLHRK